MGRLAGVNARSHLSAPVLGLGRLIFQPVTPRRAPIRGKCSSSPPVRVHLLARRRSWRGEAHRLSDSDRGVGKVSRGLTVWSAARAVRLPSSDISGLVPQIQHSKTGFGPKADAERGVRFLPKVDIDGLCVWAVSRARVSLDTNGFGSTNGRKA